MLLFHWSEALLCLFQWYISTQDIFFATHLSGFHLWVNVFLPEIQHSKYDQVPRHLRTVLLSDIQHSIYEQVPLNHKTEWIHMTGMLTETIKILCTVYGCVIWYNFGSHMLY